MLYAQDHWGLLLVFQAMDAAGKDGTIKHVTSGVNPQGCNVTSFKQPSSEELDHDYLWRYMRNVPARGQIGIFNRSYYEEVLVVKVHEELLARQKLHPSLITKKIWEERYEDIGNFERYLDFAGRVAKHVALFLAYGTAGALLVSLAGLIWLGIAGKPDLKPWHEAVLTEEFTRADANRIRDFDSYRQLEDRLFAELKREVYDRVGERDQRLLNRFSRGSRADPTSYPENGNRSYELPAQQPRAAVLVVHGLSDSPYMLRDFADKLHDRGCWVIGLRLPGHGTAPSGLKSVVWQDWAAALRLAARDLKRRAGADVPLYLVGFSTGAALSVEYSLARLEGEDLPRPEGLVLLSPAIGVDPMAALAIWQGRLAAIPGLEKLAWVDIAPEYDPYKYNSFAVNAGQQIHELTQVIDERITRLAKAGPVTGFPRTLAFQSVADATVSPVAVIRVFLGRLAAESHEVVAFDINRHAEVEPLLRPDARNPADRLLGGEAWPFDVTLLTNADPGSASLVALHRAAGSAAVSSEATNLAWPRGLFALSHVALPIPPDNPIYGAERPPDSPTVYLGRVELLGEQGMLAVPASALGRLRFNPFYSYVEERTERFLGLSSR
jgi:alpha-beta hydrolase superfamily lysophospholipase